MLYDETSEALSLWVVFCLGLSWQRFWPLSPWLAWLMFGKVPVAVADPPFPHEGQLTGIPLHARIDRELIKTHPSRSMSEIWLAGADIYATSAPSATASRQALRLGRQHVSRCAPTVGKTSHNDVVGVSDDPPAETYWKVANGIRLTGMPAFKSQVLTDTRCGR
jgi:thiosulfate dehydrogenase